VTLEGPIFVAGADGLVGSALVRRLRAREYADLRTPGRAELDLTDARAVDAFFEAERPATVFMAAAVVGGIAANDRYPADFIRPNLLIQTHTIAAAHRCGVERFVFLGSSCIYPRDAPQPLTEDALLTGPLEPTNRSYAVAKIAGVEMVEAYRRQHGFPGFTVMPTNLYGPGDDFDLETAHVVPALLRRFHEGKRDGRSEVTLWGTGTPRRELLHVDDLADAVVFLAERGFDGARVNVGCGQDLTIEELARTIAGVVGYEGRIGFDASMPDGTPRKLLDVSRLFSLGWRPSIGLVDGLSATYDWYRSVASTHQL